MSENASTGAPLQRYGLEWQGPELPVCVPMPDGYWTPWHVAQAEIERLQKYKADTNDLREKLGDSPAARMVIELEMLRVQAREQQSMRLAIQEFADSVARDARLLNEAIALLDRVVTEVGRTITPALRADIDAAMANTPAQEGEPR